MEEENKNANSEGGMPESELLAGKFKSVDALVRAYGELESEFTRRSQRLKTLEGELAAREPLAAPHAPPADEELLRAVTEKEGLRAKILSEYLKELKGVPLMAGAGAGVVAPVRKPASIREAGDLALGYLKGKK